MADETKVTVEMTVGQAQAVCASLDIATRIGIGQFEQITDLARLGTLPMMAKQGGKRTLAGVVQCGRLDAMMKGAKAELGYPANGSMGIGHPHVTRGVRRSWEVLLVLRKALAIHRDPSPSFKGCDYDGLEVRYTDDEAPKASVRSDLEGAGMTSSEMDR